MDWQEAEGPIGRAVARVMPDINRRGNAMRDDVLQEARIAVWKAEQKLGHLEPGQIYNAARYGAMNQLKRELQLRNAAQIPLSLDLMVDDLGAPRRDQDLELDVQRALQALPEAERVFITEWHLKGFPGPEAASRAGKAYKSINTTWRRYSRPTLANKLRDYREDR